MGTPSFLHVRQAKVKAALKGHMAVLSAPGLCGDSKTVMSLKDARKLLGPRPSVQNARAHLPFRMEKDPCFGKLTQETSHALRFCGRTEATQS